MYYPCSENKDADQLRGYREADLRLCFRPCKLLVFSRTGSFHLLPSFIFIIISIRRKKESVTISIYKCLWFEGKIKVGYCSLDWHVSFPK